MLAMTIDLTKRTQSENTIALVGNPNSGKTTIFNALTGLHHKIANYSGVTVEKKTGILAGDDGKTLEIVDLPGTYSLSAYSRDEAVVQDVLLGLEEGIGCPSAVLCVVDASCLERSLYLVMQVLELGLPMLLVLNMVDVLEKRGFGIQMERLGLLLGVPVMSCQANTGEGIEALKKALLENNFCIPKKNFVAFSTTERCAIDGVRGVIREFGESVSDGEIWMLLTREDTLSLQDKVLDVAIQHWRFWLDRSLPDWKAQRIRERYRKLDLVCENCLYKQKKSPTGRRWKERLDKVFLHPVFGWVFLFGILGSIFWSVFIVSFYPLGWLNAGVNGVSSWLGHILSEGAWKGLVMDGILAGVGSIVVFLPQILILFFFLGCLESSGYLPRVAFLLDKVMRRFGLSGKAFIPMLTCYACAVPGIMGTRGLNVHQERFATILVAPWASCSARLPIYLLLINILCPNSSWGGLYKVVLLMGAYGFGTFGALILSRILRKTVFTGNSHGIMMDMPDYRWPALKNVAYQMVERTWIFLSKVGSIVLIFSMIFWALMHFPYHPKLTKSQNMEQSFAGRVGHLIEPALKPLGYDWKIGVGLLSSLGSRESFISTMSVMYHVEGDNDDGPPRTVQQLFAKQKDAHGNPLYSLATCLSLITFFVFAMQCMSTVAVVRRETNSTLWALFQLIFMNVVAYVLAFIVYHITP